MSHKGCHFLKHGPFSGLYSKSMVTSVASVRWPTSVHIALVRENWECSPISHEHIHVEGVTIL